MKLYHLSYSHHDAAQLLVNQMKQSMNVVW